MHSRLTLPQGMTAPETVLAFDFGLKRIGIASGDTLTRSAAPRPAARERRVRA